MNALYGGIFLKNKEANGKYVLKGYDIKSKLI